MINLVYFERKDFEYHLKRIIIRHPITKLEKLNNFLYVKKLKKIRIQIEGV